MWTAPLKWVGSTACESVGIGGEVALTLWEMYQMNNITKQVQNCVLHDFVPDPSLYALFIPMDAHFEGNMGFVRNICSNRYIID